MAQLLVIRAGSLTSGVCSTLDPSFNVWDAVDPYAQRMLRGEPAGLSFGAGDEPEPQSQPVADAAEMPVEMVDAADGETGAR